MKKLLLLMSFMALGVGTTFAQQGEKAVGVHLGYGTEISNLGIGAKFQYGITDAIRLEGSFNYFFERDYVSMWDLNANAHYLFPIAQKFKVYPLAGLTYTNWGVGGLDFNLGKEHMSVGKVNSGRFGVNLGAGAEYELNPNLVANFELKYQLISDFNQAVFNLGLAYKF